MILDANGMPILQPAVDNAETATFNTAFAAIGTAIGTFKNSRQLQTFSWANAAGRTGQTGMANGDRGYQRDTKVSYMYDGVSWLAQNALAILSRAVTTFSTPNGASTLVNSSALDVTKLVNMTSTGGAITVVTPGNYRVSAKVQFTANATGIRQLFVNNNSLTSTTNLLLFDETPGNATAVSSTQCSRMVTLAAGDTLRMHVAQNCGASLNLLAGATQVQGTFFEAALIGTL